MIVDKGSGAAVGILVSWLLTEKANLWLRPGAKIVRNLARIAQFLFPFSFPFSLFFSTGHNFICFAWIKGVSFYFIF